MRSLRYLNTVLTLMAVLLTLHLWTLWTGGPTGDGHSPLELAATARAAGIPDAGAQRKQIIDLLKLQNQKTDQLVNLLKSGRARVRLEGASKDDDSKS